MINRLTEKELHYPHNNQLEILMNTIRLLGTFGTLLKVIPLAFLGGCSLVQVANSVSRIYPVNVEQDVAFGNHPRQTMDIYYPNENRVEQDPTPVLVFIYGGSWNRGEKSEYEFVGRKLASLGYITVVPNYRVYPEVKYPEFLEDGAQCLAKLMAHLETSRPLQGLNPAKEIVLMGHSAGAYNAAMLALDDRWLRKAGLNRQKTVSGFIGIAGAYNFYPIGNPEVKPVFHHPNYPKNSQPIDWASEGNIPSLILAPESDDLVSIEKNSVALARALKQTGAPTTILTVANTDHISIIGALSPLLFFKGDSVGPIQRFLDELTLVADTPK